MNRAVARYTFILVSLLLISNIASAVCPLCTFAVGAGIGLTQWLGIDDVITGLWLGGLTVSLIVWTVNWLNKRKITFFGKNILVTGGYYIAVIAPLYYSHTIGNLLNTLWGYDKLLLGITVGSSAFIVTTWCYEYLKKRNVNHAHFPFQKVVMPVGVLILLSLLFYCIVR